MREWKKYAIPDVITINRRGNQMNKFGSKKTEKETKKEETEEKKYKKKF